MKSRDTVNAGGSHVAYRDSFEQCPRCSAALVDAGAVRACEQCQGQWVQEPILAEMIMAMLPEGQLPDSALFTAVADRGGEQLPCPSCGERMTPVTIHGITLDRCAKLHGVWFDYPELEQSLRAIAGHPVVRPPPSPPPVAAVTPRVVPFMRFEIATPGDVVRVVETFKPIIRIGKHNKCDVRITADPLVARMHAIIELTGDAMVLIDLGSSQGTLVNGARITKHTLLDLDVFFIGSTRVTVTRTGTFREGT